MTQVAFGLFDWIDRSTAPLHQLYNDRLQLLEAADAAGFFCYHLAEHHATPLGMAPSPALFLTAAAQRTRRIRLGPLVYLLPLYNPLRLIEEVCMLDQLSGGRLELGIGRGVTPYELAIFRRRSCRHACNLQRGADGTCRRDDQQPVDIRGRALPVP